MTPTRRKRLAIVAVIVLGVGAAAAVAFTALNDAMLYFAMPTDVKAGTVPTDKPFRLGGLVAMGSVERDPDGLEVTFTVTDNRNQVPVTYRGILPDLFREGQGVIAHGRIGPDGVFQATEVLAKHDENYMPPEIARALEEAGHPSQTDE